MAKLVEILARELKEWPEGVKVLAQWPGGEVAEPLGVGIEAKEIYVSCWVACDHDDAEVTRAQWEAGRARIAEAKEASSEILRLHARVQELEASQAQRTTIPCVVPAQINQTLNRRMYATGWADCERAHNITQEKQG